MKNKGFTLIETITAVGVMLIIGAVVSILLIKYIKDSQVAGTLEDLDAIKTAITSAAVDEVLVDNNNDGDYLDDLIRVGKLDKQLTIIPGASYEVLQSATANGVTIYYLSITCSTDRCREIIQELDQKIDDGDGPTAGAVQWI